MTNRLAESEQPTNNHPQVEHKATPSGLPDLDSLRLGQDYGATLGVKKLITTVPYRKPNRQEFVRVHPGDDWRLETGIFEDQINQEGYLVERNLWPELGDDVRPICLVTTINRQGDIALWPLKLPGLDGRTNAWHDSAIRAAEIAEKSWIKIVANMTAGYYDVHSASGELSDPQWPDVTFRELLDICFRGRFINDWDHPILQAWRGAV